MHKSALPAKLLQYNLFKYGKKAIFLDYGDIVNDFQQLVREDDMVIIYTNRGNVLGSINSTLKELIKKVSFNLSIITMNDKLSLKNILRIIFGFLLRLIKVSKIILKIKLFSLFIQIFLLLK